MWNDMGSHGWWWGFGPLPMLLFWVLIIVAIVALGKWIFGKPADSPREAPRGKSNSSIRFMTAWPSSG